jgi:DNA polymerase III epsilon subunit-like protein
MPKPNFVWLDCETSGLDPVKCAPTQIAMIHGWTEDSLRINVLLREGAVADPVALQVQGATVEQLQAAGRLPERDAVAMMLDWLHAREPYVFAGMNVGFDVGFLNAMCARVGYKTKLKARALDIQGLAMFLDDLGIIELPAYPNGALKTNLDVIIEAVGSDQRQASSHDALEDVWVTRQAYWHICKFIESLASEESH